MLPPFSVFYPTLFGYIKWTTSYPSFKFTNIDDLYFVNWMLYCNYLCSNTFFCMNEALTYPVGGSALLAHNGVRRSCSVFISPYRVYQREMTTEQSAVYPPRSHGDEGGVPWVPYSLCTRGICWPLWGQWHPCTGMSCREYPLIVILPTKYCFTILCTHFCVICYYLIYLFPSLHMVVLTDQKVE